MRPVVVVVALGVVALIALAVPAAAHPGIENPYVPARVATTLALGVPSESSSPMVEVDLTLPTDFTLQRVDSVPGWQSATTPHGVRFFAGNIPEGGYAQFTFSGIFATKGVVEFPVTTIAADGSSVAWDQPPGQARPAAVALPGYPVGAAPVPGMTVMAVSGGGGHRTGEEEAGAVAAAVGLAAVAVGVSRRRRAGADTDTPEE